MVSLKSREREREGERCRLAQIDLKKLISCAIHDEPDKNILDYRKQSIWKGSAEKWTLSFYNAANLRYISISKKKNLSTKRNKEFVWNYTQRLFQAPKPEPIRIFRIYFNKDYFFPWTCYLLQKEKVKKKKDTKKKEKNRQSTPKLNFTPSIAYGKEVRSRTKVLLWLSSMESIFRKVETDKRLLGEWRNWIHEINEIIDSSVWSIDRPRASYQY